MRSPLDSNEILTRYNDKPFRYYEQLTRNNEKPTRNNENLSRNNEQLTRSNEKLTLYSEKPTRNNEKRTHYNEKRTSTSSLFLARNTDYRYNVDNHTLLWPACKKWLSRKRERERERERESIMKNIKYLTKMDILKLVLCFWFWYKWTDVSSGKNIQLQAN